MKTYKENCRKDPNHKNHKVEATRKTSRQRYGVDNVAQLPEFQRSRRAEYVFDDIFFDSKHELALYVFLKDHYSHFEFHSSKFFEYSFDGKLKRYFPDACLDEKAFVEIKGDHFFNEHGKMICPFRKEEWTDEQYQHECERYEAKHQCMLKNNVIIMRTSSLCMKFVLKYASMKIGNLKNFRRSKYDTQ